MTDVLKVLTNIRSLRVIARDLALEQLESILEKIQLVVAEKKEELLKAQQEENDRQERIAKYKELLKQEGITTDELAEILGSNVVRKKRESRPAKYQYVDENGDKVRPVVVHRAILGSLDRFVAFLLEETTGNLPVWLAPVQVKVLPISDKYGVTKTWTGQGRTPKAIQVQLDKGKSLSSFEI